MFTICDETSNGDDVFLNTLILSSGSSLIDMLNQQSSQTNNKDSKNQINETQNLTTNNFNNDKLSTLFNTTGRERNSTGPLKQWLYEHQDHPYPNDNDKQELMEKTQMSTSQITIWFTNARAKMRKENKLLSKSNDKKKKSKEENDIDEFISFTNQLFPCKQYVFAYSSLNSKEINDLHYLISLYPNQMSISDSVNDHTTHLIIGKEEKTLLCPLTKKLFQSIARHLYIISFRWINDCLNENNILNENNYEIRGDIPFDNYHDGMKKSRLAKNIKLFNNCEFFILCNHCQNYMSKNELISLIELCDGTILDTFPIITTTDSSKLTIVLCNEVLSFDNSCEKQLFELSRSNGVHFLHPEWILESIVHFQLQSFEFYEEKF